MLEKIRSFIFGDPLKVDNSNSVSYSNARALSILASDVLSSIAYSPECIVVSLGVSLSAIFLFPISCTIVVLIFFIASSYCQTIDAYPEGGGDAYSVVNDNLGENCSLAAAAAQLIDYTLTVAVSLSAGALAIVSAFPSFSKYMIPFCLIVLCVISIHKIRSSHESGKLLSIPTFFFIFCFAVMIIVGLYREVPLENQLFFFNSGDNKLQSMSNVMIAIAVIRAFSAGCSVMTGMESMSGGVSLFRAPKGENAKITLCIICTILAILFLGVSFLAAKYHVAASSTQTVTSQIAAGVFTHGSFAYYCVQLATAGIFLLAINTAFGSFTSLSSTLAKDNYIPTRFSRLGDRLAYTNSILAIAFVSAFLVIIFKGNMMTLVSLYSLGVLISFTISQASMVRRWFVKRGHNWHIKLVLNVFGSCATLVTVLTIIESSFKDVWVVLFLISVLVPTFKIINKKYTATNTELDLKVGGLSELFAFQNKQLTPKVVIPISRIHKGTLSAINFALSLSNDVTAVIVNINQKEIDKLKLVWVALKLPVPLVILSSPYRSITTPLLNFLSEQDERNPEKGKTVVIMPSFVPTQQWQNILHNQTATSFKTALMYRKSRDERMRVIVEIPYKMKQ